MDHRIRLALESDADAMAAIYRPIVETTTISFEAVPPTAEELARRVTETTTSHPWLVCERGGQVAGYAYASPHRSRAAYRWSVDTSVYVANDHQRAGVGRGLYVSLFAILAAQGFFNAYAGIALPNPASVALHESLGFEKIGVYRRVGFKHGAWHDVGWWQLTLRAFEPSPKEPLGLAAIRKHSEWGALVASGEPHIRGRAAEIS
jgi:L-amino acid N-acyltransferase YncA